MIRPCPVLLVVRELGIGGCERDLTKIALGLDRSRWKPHVGCFRSHGFRSGELEAAGIPIVELPVTSFQNLSLLRGGRALRRYSKEHDIQLIECFDDPLVAFGVPAARAAGIPAVISCQLSFRELTPLRLRPLLGLADQLTDMVVVNSEAVRRHLTRDWGVPVSRISVRYNGVDSRIFCPGKPLNCPLGLVDAALVVGTVCALREEKQVNILIEAFALISARHSSIKLVIVGSGPMLGRRHALARDRGIVDRTVFQPSTSNVVPWMQSMDIFVLPSRSESFPDALLEAMACGCAVIGTAVGGIPELITDKESGMLFASGDVQELAAILDLLLTSDAQRVRMGTAALGRARTDFSLERMIACTDQLYSTLLGRIDI